MTNEEKPIKPDVFVPIDWGTHIVCSDCGEKIIRGIIPFVKHQEICLRNKTEDADFEIMPPKQLPSTNKTDEP